MRDTRKPDWVLYMGTFPPRECGIATFTKDLTTAMDRNFSPTLKTKIVAINNDVTSTYNYPRNVLFQINDCDIQDYIDMAKKINKMEEIKAINIQHEFGIFGGEYGSYLIAFLEIVNKPVIITFHSVLPNPNERLKKVVQALSEKVDCVVVMAEIGLKILREEYGIKADIEVIPHGIPNIPFVLNKKEKEKIGYGGRIFLLSFGMVNPGKGYEYVIDALPNIVKKFPKVLYLIVGETHPIVRKNEGENYRNLIEKMVKELKLEKNVKFYNKYVKLEEIIQYLKAADIYICSNVNAEQVTSGTLAYAVGAGRAVISTPFLHAKELVTPSRGILANFNDAKSFEDAITKILSSPQLKKNMEKDAYENTRHMTWNNVALAYNNIFKKYTNLFGEHLTSVPEIKMDHLIRLTDDFGIIQFAKYTNPNTAWGYTLDDNSRAMIVCCKHYDIFKDGPSLKLIRIYLDFIKYVMRNGGRLYNFVGYDRKINLEDWSKDAHGRALWSLGVLVNTGAIPEELKKKAGGIFKRALKVIGNIKSPRSVAFIIEALYNYNKANPSDKNVKKIKRLADYLVSLYRNSSSKEWRWFEEYLTYTNSKLSEALFYAYIATKKREYLRIAKSSLEFLSSITFENGLFVPIGESGWYMKKGHKAYFDQQPINTSSMVQTLLVANMVTRKKIYLRDAIKAFQWFLGKNSLNQAVYDRLSGGCYDGVGEFSLNLNQGAESTISYLLARLYLHNEKKKV